MKTLDLILKGKWYDMIDAGIKREEYREIKSYWIKRLCHTRLDNPFVYCVKESCCAECLNESLQDWCAYPFDWVTFHRSYTNTTMTFEVESIVIDKGNPEWGAEPDKAYFVIKLGKRK